MDLVAAVTECLAGNGTAWWEWTGRVVARVPGRPEVHLADLRGTDAVRAVAGPADGGTGGLLGLRRARLVVDPVTGEIADRIEVPWSDVPVPVEHVWLDPVLEVPAEWAAVAEVTVDGPPTGSPTGSPDGSPGSPDAPDVPSRPPDAPVGAAPADRGPADAVAHVVLARERFWREPFPLSARQWPGAAPGPLLELAETTHLVGRLAPPGAAGAAAWGSVTRIEPWWPTFALGETPGQLLVHLRGRRRASWSEVGAPLRRAVEARRPEFAHPPASADLSWATRSVDHLWDALAATRRIPPDEPLVEGYGPALAAAARSPRSGRLRRRGR